MRGMAALLARRLDALRDMLVRGFHASPSTVLLLAAINTGIAAVLWVEDTRPFWQPLLTVQLYGFAIAYCVNAALPWNKPRPIVRLMVAVAIGTLLGVTRQTMHRKYRSVG